MQVVKTGELRCRCGAIQGTVEPRHLYCRAVCYCTDCQVFARYLGSPGENLDSRGGTEIVAILPAAVRFTAGVDKLACMSLSEKGLLRWYASCCRTPIGNTPRGWKTSYVGLIRTSLPTLDESFGPLKISFHAKSAHDHVEAAPLATFLAIMRIMRKIIGARLSGRYKENPFFNASSGAPVSMPQVLTLAERKSLEATA